jgi:hypothetical protein
VVGAFTVPAVCSGSRNPSRGVLTNVEGIVWQTSSLRNTEQDNSDLGSNVEKKKNMPEPLLPFLPAADPMYMCRGPVGDKQFILTREGPSTPEELSNENLLRILRIECSDLEVSSDKSIISKIGKDIWANVRNIAPNNGMLHQTLSCSNMMHIFIQICSHKYRLNFLQLSCYDKRCYLFIVGKYACLEMSGLPI